MGFNFGTYSICRLEMRNMKRPFFKKYLTDRADTTGGVTWYRIESSFKPSIQDIELVQKDFGFDPLFFKPDQIEISVGKLQWLTTWCSSD